MLTTKIESLFHLPEKKYYLCSMNVPDEKGIIERDWVREQTLGLLAREIERRKVPGEVAELGVFRGEFAKKINKLFKDRKLYLFDTFEGFAEADVKSDSALNWGHKIDTFKDTTIEKVMDAMPYKEMCIVKKGFFPDTYDVTNETFSFVSIDADLYEPIKAGLEIFYPRLNRGGYIMVHDYNNIVYGGATKAVQEFCDEHKISYIPIPDMAGSVIITK